MSSGNIAFCGHKSRGIHVEPIVAQHCVSKVYTGQYGEDRNGIHEPAYAACAFGIVGSHRFVFHKFNTDESRQGYENRVDEEQVKRSKEVGKLHGGESVTGCTQRRHECRSYGYARYYVSLAARTYRHYSGCSTEESDENIVDCRGSSGKKFTMAFAYR